jgi:signal transduction histidine kinase
MNMPEPDSRLEAWERWERPAIAALPYLMLTITVIVTFLVFTGSDGSLLIDMGGVGLAAGLLVTFTLWRAVRERPRLMAVYFTVLVTVMAVLVIRIPWFGFFTFTGYFYAYYLPLGWQRLLGVGAVALVTGTSQNGGLPRHTPIAITIWVVIVSVNLLVAEGLTWFSSVSSEQNDRRKLLVTELSEANRKLTASLEENAGLHVQLLAQAREAGVLDERQRMAREIHDTLAQGLTGIITQLEAAGQAGKSAEQWRHHFDSANRLARESLSEARRSVHALQPEPLEMARLPDALAEVADRWSARSGVAVQVTTTGRAQPMRPEIEVALLRTAQEALANVARHARASRVGLTLSYMDDEIALDIRDDGVGFEPSGAGGLDGAAPGHAPAVGGQGAIPTESGPVPGEGGSVPVEWGPERGGRRSLNGSAGHRGEGFGLTAMRQRVEGLAGTLEIESEIGTGTAISASVPAIPAGAGQ